MSDVTWSINPPDNPAWGEWGGVIQNGILIILDAQDDVPSDYSNGILLEIGKSSHGLAVYLVLVQSSRLGDGSVAPPESYRRIGLAIHLNTQGRTKDEVNRIHDRYKFMSEDRVMGIRQGEIRQLYLV